MQVKQALGLKGLFLRGPKPGSLDSHAAGRPPPRPSVSQRLLRRTASAPTKSQKPGRKAFPELVLGTQDTGSEGEVRDVAAPSPGPTLEAPGPEEPGSRSPRGKAPVRKSPMPQNLGQEPPPCAPEGPGPAGMAATCMKCVVGSCAGEDAEGLRQGRLPSPGSLATHEAISQQPRARADSLGAPCAGMGRGRGAPRQGPGGSSVSTDSSGLGSPEVFPHWPEGARRQAGALQREMNALFVQKLEEIRSNSSMLSTGKTRRSWPASLCCPLRPLRHGLGQAPSLCFCVQNLPPCARLAASPLLRWLAWASPAAPSTPSPADGANPLLPSETPHEPLSESRSDSSCGAH